MKRFGMNFAGFSTGTVSFFHIFAFNFSYFGKSFFLPFFNGRK